jgi:two-component sensor histidine kinase
MQSQKVSELFKRLDQKYRDDIEMIIAKMTMFIMALHLIDMAESYWYGYEASLIWEILRIVAVAFVMIPKRVFGIGGGLVGHLIVVLPLIFLYGTFWLPDENYFYTLPWLIVILISPFWFFDKETAKKWAIIQVSIIGILTILSAVGLIHTLFNTSLLFQMTGTMMLVAAIMYKIESKRDLYKQSIEELALENSVLYDEIQHRTKNNLQWIISLIMQEETARDDEACRQTLKGLAQRVQAFESVVALRAEAQEDHIDLRAMIDRVVELYRNELNDCAFAIEVDEVKVHYKIANPLMLIVNESLSNIRKYACPAGADRIRIVAKRLDEKRIELRIEDNAPTGDETANPTEGSGMRIVRRLVDSLPEGHVEIERDTGYSLVVTCACLS